RRVVGVQRGQHHVPGEGCLDGDLRGLVVTDLTEQHDVRVGAQDGAQRAGERQAGLRVHLDLVDAGQAVLDRVLDGDDVDLRLGDGVEGRVQGGRLPGPGRAGHEDHAVRLAV